MVKNFKTVAIISSNEGFIVKGLETKLKEIGFDYMFCPDVIEAIEAVRSIVDVFVFYLQNEMNTETLVYMKDILNEDSKRAIVIGEPVEYEKVEQVLTEALVYKWFDRPLDMNMFLKAVETNAFEDHTAVEKKTILYSGKNGKTLY